MFSFTPFGSGINFFPTRDIFLSLKLHYSHRLTQLPERLALPDVTENFSANAFFTSTRSRHHSTRRRQDVDPQPAQNTGHCFRPDIHPAARTRHTFDARDH